MLFIEIKLDQSIKNDAKKQGRGKGTKIVSKTEPDREIWVVTIMEIQFHSKVHLNPTFSLQAIQVLAR